MRLLVTREFDSADVIGYLQLRDGVEIPLHSVFSLAYLVEERDSIGKPTKGRVQSISLISDEQFVQYLESQKSSEEQAAKENATNGELKDWTCDRCSKTYRFFEVKQPLKFKDDPEQRIITVCAQCLKDLRREGRVLIEYH